MSTPTRFPLSLTLLVMLPGLVTISCAETSVPDETSADTAQDHYTYQRGSFDGIGKFYMGREISHVMGHQGAGWLERPTREREERTDLLLANLPIERDSVVADIGAGTGYFSLPMARRVPDGRVLAVDIQPEMLAIIEERAQEAGIENIERILATEDDPGLPESTVDMALFVDAYHEFSFPREVMSAVQTSLVPGGRVILVEYRGEDPTVPIKPLHKMTQDQARKEMAAVGLEWVETIDVLPQQHLMVFERPVSDN